MPEGMPDKVPEGMSDRTPEDLPVRMPEGMPDRMSDRMPEDMPDKVPECLPEHMPEDMPDRMSEDMPEDMPDRMPEDMPDKMPEGMSDRMPEDLPVTKRIDVMVGITRSKVIWSCFWPENLQRERWCPGVVEPYDANSGVRKSNPSDAAAAKTGGKMHPRHLKWLIIIIIIAMLHQAPTMTPGERGEGVMAARHKSHLTNPGGIHHVTPGSPRGPCTSQFDTHSNVQAERRVSHPLSSWTKIVPTLQLKAGNHFEAATKYLSSRCLRIGKVIPFLFIRKEPSHGRCKSQKLKLPTPPPIATMLRGSRLEPVHQVVALHQVKPLACWGNRSIVNHGWFCGKSSTWLRP